mgnify:CR=1 FL=1
MVSLSLRAVFCESPRTDVSIFSRLADSFFICAEAILDSVNTPKEIEIRRKILNELKARKGVLRCNRAKESRGAGLRTIKPAESRSR